MSICSRYAYDILITILELTYVKELVEPSRSHECCSDLDGLVVLALERMLFENSVMLLMP